MCKYAHTYVCGTTPLNWAGRVLNAQIATAATTRDVEAPVRRRVAKLGVSTLLTAIANNTPTPAAGIVVTNRQLRLGGKIVDLGL